MSKCSTTRRWRCRRHPDKFVNPSRQKRGKRTGCGNCTNEYTRSPEAKARRAKKFDDNGDIWCANHPERLAQRAYFVHTGGRECGSCRSRNSDGGLRKGFIRSKRKHRYKIIMKLRGRLGGHTRGLKLFERVTGFAIPKGWYNEQGQ